MSAIDDLSKAREALYGGVWTWEPHGPPGAWALYVNRGQPIFPDRPRSIGNIQHGLNILSVGSDGFDANGEALRAFILEAADKVPVLAAERDAERKAWARLVKATDSVRIAANLNDQALFAKAMTEHAGAMQALRDLGVDVDALMEAK